MWKKNREMVRGSLRWNKIWTSKGKNKWILDQSERNIEKLFSNQPDFAVSTLLRVI